MNVSVSADKTLEGLRRLSESLALAADLVATETMDAIAQHARSTKLWKDGPGHAGTPHTRETIRIQRLGRGDGYVIAGGASHFLENGTRAHRIEAKYASALRFMVAGRIVFRRWIDHPGTSARPFMRQARDHGEVVAEFASEVHFTRAIEQ